MNIKFWGTRGSVPVAEKEYCNYGGNTPCIELNIDGEIIILDAGSGIRGLGEKLLSNGVSGKISLIITHAHWDHIQGLPFFTPFYNPKFKFDIYYGADENLTGKDLFDAQMKPYFFPITRKQFNAQLAFHDFFGNYQGKIGEVCIESMRVHHSLNTSAYKFTYKDSVFIYMTDNELFYDVNDKIPDRNKIKKKNKDLLKFCKGADYLVHDTMFLKNDFPSKQGWGHSDNISTAVFADMAKVKNLILFHYAPEYRDDKVDQMYRETREFLLTMKSQVNVLFSYDGLEINIEDENA